MKFVVSFLAAATKKVERKINKMIYVSHSQATAERSKGGRMHQQQNIMHCTIYPVLDSLIYSIKKGSKQIAFTMQKWIVFVCGVDDEEEEGKKNRFHRNHLQIN